MKTQLKIIAALHLLYGACMLLFALLAPLGCISGAMDDPALAHMAHPWLVGLAAGLVMGGFVFVLGAIYLVGGAGLLLPRWHRWGWIVALIGSVLWISTCCAPVGIWGLIVILLDRSSQGGAPASS